MPTLSFYPIAKSIEAAPQSKILAAANKAKVGLRSGCAACRCGTCAVRVGGTGELSPIGVEEAKLLAKLGLSLAGDIRLACQARIINGEVSVDLSFQDTYDPSTMTDED